MEIRKHYASFSEAIREGAKLRPQAEGALRRNGKTCAIGAGLDAMGLLTGVCDSLSLGDGNSPEYDEFCAIYPYLVEAETDCPSEEHFKYTCKVDALFEQVIHLNDSHLWPRERIADWLESEEEKLGFITLVESESPQVIESQTEELECVRLCLKVR